MSNPKEWAEAIKDILNWSAPILPIKLGWVIVGTVVFYGLIQLIRAWRKP